MRSLIRKLLSSGAALLLLITAGVAQCDDPRAPSGGFKLRVGLEEPLTFADSYRTVASVAYPLARPGRCGWPVLVLVPGLGAGSQDMLPESRSFARRGYFVIAYDVRGQRLARFLNPRRQSRLWTLDEWIDLAEVIDWTGSHFRGIADVSRVAVLGDSQGGLHAWAAAAYSGKTLPTNPRRKAPFPKIACVAARIFAPQSVDVWVPGGQAFAARLADFVYTVGHPAVALDPTFRKKVIGYLDADDPVGLAQFLHAAPGRDFVQELRTSNVPVLHTGTWHDQFMMANPALRALESLPSTVVRRSYLGTGFHGTPLNTYQFLHRQEILTDWFDRWLKKRGVADKAPPFLIAAMPTDPVRYAHPHALWRHRADRRFPPLDVVHQRWYLRSGGLLRQRPPQSPEGPLVLRNRVAAGYSARAFQKDGRKPLLVQRSIPLEATRCLTVPFLTSVEVVGVPVVTLSVRPTRKAFQVGVRITAIDAAGRRQLISAGGFATRQANTARPQSIPIELSAVDTVLPRGGRLEIEVANQVIQTPGLFDEYRWIPIMQDFDVTIGLRPTRLSFLDLPVRPRVRADLTTGVTELSVARPTDVRAQIRSSLQRAGSAYLVLVSLTGQAPWPLTGGNTLWLSRDAATDFFLGLANTPAFSGFAGVLDRNGAAIATMKLRGLPLPNALVGDSLHMVAVVADKTGIEGTAPLQIRLR